MGLSAHAYTVAEIARVDRLLNLIDQRLQISERVAQAKWNTGGAIEDTAREARVIDDFVASATAAGMDPTTARDFIQAQIEASKTRQRELTGSWRRAHREPFAQAPDLARDIRPALDLLGQRLLGSLHQAQPVSSVLLKWRVDVIWGSDPNAARRAALEGLPR